MASLTATEASRNFSELLNRVSSGERIEITRAGVPVAVIEAPRNRVLSSQDFAAVFEALPPVDEDFIEEIRRIRDEIPAEGDPWQ